MRTGGKTISRKRIIIYITAPLLLAALVLLYSRFNPEGNALFPKCIFHSLTGLKCPGCGSQRVVHYLLNGDIASAWKMNQLMIVSIPYLILGYLAEVLQHRYSWALWVRKRIFGVTAVWIVFSAVMLFAIFRNLLHF